MSSLFLKFPTQSEKEEEKPEDIQELKTAQQKIQNHINVLAELK
jgi:hypothetical protein